MPYPGGRSLRTPPVMGGLLPVRRSHITAELVAVLILAVVSIPVALG